MPVLPWLMRDFGCQAKSLRAAIGWRPARARRGRWPPGRWSLSFYMLHRRSAIGC